MHGSPPASGSTCSFGPGHCFRRHCPGTAPPAIHVVTEGFGNPCRGCRSSRSRAAAITPWFCIATVSAEQGRDGGVRGTVIAGERGRDRAAERAEPAQRCVGAKVEPSQQRGRRVAAAAHGGEQGPASPRRPAPGRAQELQRSLWIEAYGEPGRPSHRQRHRRFCQRRREHSGDTQCHPRCKEVAAVPIGPGAPGLQARGRERRAEPAFEELNRRFPHGPCWTIAEAFG